MQATITTAKLIHDRSLLLIALRNLTECAEAGVDGANMDLWIEQAKEVMAQVEGVEIRIRSHA